MDEKLLEAAKMVMELIGVIEGLMNIAQVAMPPDLFEIDPRVVKAQALLADLKGEIQ